MQGDVSFLELGSVAAESSQRFFHSVFGWKFHPMTNGEGWFETPAMRVGLHANDPQPRVYVFFAVANLERAIAAVRTAGGEATDPLPEEPGFGRFANCKDPQGIAFGLHQAAARG